MNGNINKFVISELGVGFMILLLLYLELNLKTLGMVGNAKKYRYTNDSHAIIKIKRSSLYMESIKCLTPSLVTNLTLSIGR